MFFSFRRLMLLTILALPLVACGQSPTAASPTSLAPSAVNAVATTSGDLSIVKTYLIAQSTTMKSHAEAFRTETTRYYDAVKAANFDYEAAWGNNGAGLRPTVLKMRETWSNTDNAYETIEGIVAGVPSLAPHDVILDSGRAEGEGAVAPITLHLPNGTTVTNPGSFLNWLIEPTLFGTKQAWVGATDIDVDGDGSIGFGDALPEANMVKGEADGLVAAVDTALTAINAWQPTAQDAFTALLVMTPTMDEYFANWKTSRFVLGETAARDQVAFVAKTRLTDVTRIVRSINVIYSGVHPSIAAKNPGLADQIVVGYRDLETFVNDLYSKEASGVVFTPDQADTLGQEAQNRAQLIAGQVAQAAATLGIAIQQ